MMTTAKIKMMDPMLSMIHRMMSNGRGERVISEGLIEVPHHNAGSAYSVIDDYEELPNDCANYGVCDSPEQALSYASERLCSHPEGFCVFVTHVSKDPSNAGRGGGWRWHKWGEYIGNGSPQREYLDDEEGFADGVWCFHIYRVAPPPPKELQGEAR